MSIAKKLKPYQIYQIIEKFGPPYDSIPFQSFNGIYNKTENGTKGYYCFAISFFQLLMHSENVLNYLKNPNLQNSTEILLSNIYKKLYSKRKIQAITLAEFLKNWRGWCSSNGHLVNDSEDISEFCIYLLHSCSYEFKKMFLIEYNKNQEFPPDSPYFNDFFFRLELVDINIQNLINNHLQKNKVIRLPKNLFLYLPRLNKTKICDSNININTFIKVKNINYKFVGCSIFLGKLPNAHYVTFIKFYDKFVKFDDELTSCLFYYNNCPDKVIIDMKDAELKLTHRSVFYFYSQYDEPVHDREWNLYEEIFTDNVRKIYDSLCQIQSKKNKKNLLANTLNIISKKSINKNVLNNIVQSQNSSPQRIVVSQQNSSPQRTLNSSKMHCVQKRKKTSNKMKKNTSIESPREILKSKEKKQSISNENHGSFDESLKDNLHISPERGQSMSSENHNSTGKNEILQDDNCIPLDKSQNISEKEHNSQEKGVILQEENEFIQFGEGTCVSKSTFLNLQADDSDQNIEFSQPFNDSDPLPSSDIELGSQIESIISSDSEEDNNERVRQKIEQCNHLLLQKESIIIDDMIDTSLFGKLEFNNSNVPENAAERLDESKYIKYRKIFKIVGRLLRKLNYADQGQINSEILLNKLQVDVTTDKEIKEQGEILYKIIKDHVNDENIDLKTMKNEMNPIFDWYKQKYHLDPEALPITEYIINETLETHIELYKMSPTDIYLPESFDIDKYLQDDSNFRDDSLDDDYKIEEKEGLNEEEEEEWSTSTDDDFSDKEDMIDLDGDEVEDDPKEDLTLNLTNAQRVRYDYLRKSHTAAALRSIISDIDDYINWKNCDFGCSNFEEDDNHCIAECYFWKDRVEILNIEEIIENIREKMTQKKPNVKGLNLTITQLKISIEHDMYRKFLSNPDNKINIKKFAHDYLRLTNDPENMPELVKMYKNHKGIDEDKNFMSEKTIRNKIYTFNSMSREDQRKLLRRRPEDAKHGGFRKDNIKVTDETIKCIVTLLVDFPNLSSRAITAYINSPFGTNYKKPLDDRTVQRYMKNLDFTVKKATFAPPNRNSIGLRIFRVAWCKIIEKISRKQNVLIGFIDEASVSTNEGPKKGRSYIGISPVINSPLSKTKLSVLSLVLPGFGVLYQFVDNSVNNKQYSNFLKDAVRFIRKYICNDETEIIFFEDNCPIHCTYEVESTIKDLKIALLPIVPYSPSLNGIVEGLFGYVKTNFIRAIEQADEERIKEQIVDNWREFINNHFDLNLAHSLYEEWKLRMNECMKGKAIYSGHVEHDNSVKFNIDNLQYITVDRLKVEQFSNAKDLTF